MSLSQFIYLFSQISIIASYLVSPKCMTTAGPCLRRCRSQHDTLLLRSVSGFLLPSFKQSPNCLNMASLLSDPKLGFKIMSVNSMFQPSPTSQHRAWGFGFFLLESHPFLTDAPPYPLISSLNTQPLMCSPNKEPEDKTSHFSTSCGTPAI